MCESSCWGGYYAYLSCQTLFFSVIEIFLAFKKLTYSFQFVAGGAGSYAAFSHILTWVEK
jgi:hypothetical protein